MPLFILFYTGNKESVVQEIPKVVEENASFKKTAVATYHGVDGSPLSKDILADITQFQVCQIFEQYYFAAIEINFDDILFATI